EPTIGPAHSSARARREQVHMKAPSPPELAASNDALKFVLGLASAEDLLPIEGGRYLVASSFDANRAVGLYLVDTAEKTARPMQLSVAAQPDAQFGPSPGPPDFNKIYTHGLEIGPMNAGAHLVYTVNHGGRESIEVFRVNA